MDRARGSPVWALIATGVLVRAVVALSTGGLPFDVRSFELVRAALEQRPLHLYSQVNGGGLFRWPYPPGFLPFVLLADGLAHVFGGGFTRLIRVPAILADAALGYLVWRGLAGRVGERRRLAAAALVALGPVFVTIAGYATQIDSVAILPAVLALLAWEREEPGRGWQAGLLLGLAGAIKTVPLVMILALAPSARSPRELLELVGGAAAVLVACLLPFLLADGSGVLALRRYAGSPGLGGLSLVLQPNLALAWLIRPVAFSGLTRWLFLDHAWVPNAALLAAFGVYAARRRPPPRQAAALLWLMVLAFGSGFFFQYLVWGLPFFLLAGAVLGTAVLQAVVTVPMFIFYVTAWRSRAAADVYIVLMLALWVGWVVAAGCVARGARMARLGRVARGARAP